MGLYWEREFKMSAFTYLAPYGFGWEGKACQALDWGTFTWLL
jgi:hypothetical protein